MFVEVQHLVEMSVMLGNPLKSPSDFNQINQPKDAKGVCTNSFFSFPSWFWRIDWLPFGWESEVIPVICLAIHLFCPGAPSWHLRVVIQCWNPPEFKCHRPMVPWEEVAKELKKVGKPKTKVGGLCSTCDVAVCVCVFMFKSTGYLVQWNSCIHCMDGWRLEMRRWRWSQTLAGGCAEPHTSPNGWIAIDFKMVARSQWKNNCCSRCEGTLTKWPALSHWILLICIDLSSPQSRPRPLGPAATNAARGRTTAIELTVPNKETTFPSSWASETSQVLTDLHLENQELLVHSLNPECA